MPDGSLVEISSSQWADGLFDVVWSETDANIAVSASGDGVLQLWNVSCPQVIPKVMWILLKDYIIKNLFVLVW